MKIAIIGAGISGLTCAYHLQDRHDLTLFEANDYAGGHTDTHTLTIEGRSVNVDTGFIVFNEHNYPNFTQMLQSLGVRWHNTDMSFSVTNELNGLAYGATGLNRLFAQRRNLVSPRFYRMLWDINRFYREAPALLESTDNEQTLGDYLRTNAYSEIFVNDHIIPMACALWSGAAEIIEQFPARYFVSFMANHRMLQVNGRPQWRTVTGGSSQYVKALLGRVNATVHLSSPVESVSRNASGVTIRVRGQEAQRFDQVIFACHSDQALALLKQPTEAERSVLGAIAYQPNSVTLHCDERLMPGPKAAWASWNARIPRAGAERCSVSYWMNLLQGIPVKTPLIVSLNSEPHIDPEKVFLTRNYEHPVYTRDTLIAQSRWAEISGANHSHFCGAYWGWGFHEDGVRSALAVVQGLEALQDVAA